MNIDMYAPLILGMTKEERWKFSAEWLWETGIRKKEGRPGRCKADFGKGCSADSFPIPRPSYASWRSNED